MISLLLILSLTLPLPVHSMSPDWNPGVLVTNKQEVINGSLLYDPKFELVQLKVDGKIQTLSTDRVHSFRFYDQQQELHRRFIAINNEALAPNHQTAFYELIFSGEYSLLRKHNNITTPNPPIERNMTYEFSKERLMYEQVIGFSYYIEHHHQFFPLQDFRKKLWPLIQPEESMQSYISEEKLSLHKKGDQVKMLIHYNQLLKNKDSKISRTTH